MSNARTQRIKGGVAFRVTERDIDILKAVNRYRYMRTGQIKRLIFPENQSSQSCQKRLKLLFHNKYLGRAHPFLQYGNEGQNSEVAYFLDQAGAKCLNENGIGLVFSRTKKRLKHNPQLHALDLAEFRVNLELALQQAESLTLRLFVPDFLLKEGATSLTGLKRYRLYEEIRDPATGQTTVFFPDAAVILESPQNEAKRLFFVEIDRGTEGLETIRRKIAAYHLYATHRLYSKYGDFDRFIVLFQTNSPRRAANMVRLINEMQCKPTTLVTDHKQVTATTLLKGDIWQTSQGKIISLIR